MTTKTIKRMLAALLAATTVCSLAACGNEAPAESSAAKESSETVSSESAASEPEASSEEEEDLYYNKEGYPICDEKITIKVGGVQGNSPDWNNTLLVKTVEEKLGIILECEPMAADAFKQQYALMLTTGEIPDLILNAAMDKEQVNQDGADGYWLDLSEYMDLMPNMQAFMEKYPSFAEYQKTADGNIYSLSRITTGLANQVYSQIYYNRSQVEAAGYTGEIETVDDFYEALKAVKAANPDIYPFAMTPDKAPGYRSDVILRTSFGIDDSANSFMLDADDNGKVFLADISDNNREYLKFVNKLYEEELLDPNAFIATQDEFRANIDAGKYVFYSDTGFRVNDPADKEESQKPDTDKAYLEKYDRIFALTSDLQPETTYIRNNGVLAQAKIFVNAETEYPEAIARLLDYFTTEEGQMLALYGIEGETYKVETDDYGVESIEYEEFADLTNYESAAKWQNGAVVINQGFAFNWGPDTLEKLSVDQLEQIAADPSHSKYESAKRLLGWYDIDRQLVSTVPVSFTSEKLDAVVTMKTDIINYLVQMKVSFMTGETDPYDDAAWTEYVEQVKSMGLDQILEAEQEKYDALNK